MKKALPMPAVVGIIAVAVLFVGFLIFRNAGATQEFAAPKTDKVIPRYIWDNMKPEMQEKMKSEGYNVADVKPGGPSGQPGAPK